MIYFITYPKGDGAWFKSMAALLESIEYDAYGLKDCHVYRLDPGLDVIAEVEVALRDYDEALAWDGDHEAFISSPEKTGRL
jgi:hypothetical protein